MDYNQTTEWLFSRVASYQSVGGAAYKPGLETIQTLLEFVGNPHLKLKSVHLAGTNGKGSTAHILASVLQENGYKVGIYTSPHIKDFRERIKINGDYIGEQDVVDFIEKYRGGSLAIDPSFFELTTALAFWYFEKEAVDIAIVEAGLGGRLDATNVVIPEVSVITNIGLEHTEYLGNTLEEIAREKGGIIKKGIPVVVGETTSETAAVFEAMANAQASKLYYPDQVDIQSDFVARYQQKNLRLAKKTLDVLSGLGWKLDEAKTTEGFKKIVTNTNFRARFELLNETPRIIVDAAHNPDGIMTLMAEVMLLNFDHLHLIYGTSKDKDLNKIFKFLPKDASFYFTSFNSERAQSVMHLEAKAHEFKLEDHDTFSSPSEALKRAKQNASPSDLILVFGSFFLLEEIL